MGRGDVSPCPIGIDAPVRDVRNVRKVTQLTELTLGT